MRPNFFTRLLEKSTGSVRTLGQTTGPLEESDIGRENQSLVEELFGLSDFVRNDPEDTVFEEFDSPFPPETPFEWQPRRPAVVWSSVIRSVSTVVQLTLCGTFIGAFAVGPFYIVINTMDLSLGSFGGCAESNPISHASCRTLFARFCVRVLAIPDSVDNL